MGKYDEFELYDEIIMGSGHTNICELLIRVCNELAESNRLKRIELNTKYPSSNLLDDA